MLTAEIAAPLCDAAERALGLEGLIRYRGKHYFTAETARHDASAAVEGTPRLESVADHCWHLGYLATLLLPYFPQLNAARVHALITLHDILELITGDEDPTGQDGTGHAGHAFNADLAAAKKQIERQALDAYLAPLPALVADTHRAVLMEELDCATAEAKFVKVLDKMQCLFFIRAIKRGSHSAAGLTFSTTQRDKIIPLFPELAPLYDEALARLRADNRADVAA